MTPTFLRLTLALTFAGCARSADGKPEATPGSSASSTPTPAPPPAAPAAPAAVTPAPVATPDNDSLLARADHGRIMGSPDARVWLIVVSDFQCPYCREWHATVAEPLRRQYVQTGKVRIAYLNFPLGQHPHAWPAAEIAMCSGAQGKFWPVHDAIFATQVTWNGIPAAAAASYFDSLAVSKGVDAARLRSCVASRALRPLIQADYDRSRKSGVQSTPTVIIGSELLPGVYPLEAYRRVLDSALVAARPAR